MANYYGVGRSNYFKVKDVAALTTALEDFDYEVVAGAEPNTVTVLARNESGDWVAYAWGDDEEDDTEVDIIDLIAEHLAPGEVAVFHSTGNEKLRYVNGFAIAVNASGDRVSVTLDDIYDKAAEAFDVDATTISMAIY